MVNDPETVRDDPEVRPLCSGCQRARYTFSRNDLVVFAVGELVDGQARGLSVRISDRTYTSGTHLCGAVPLRHHIRN